MSTFNPAAAPSDGGYALVKHDAQPFRKGQDVEMKSTGKIGTVLEVDEEWDEVLVEWRDGTESRVAASKLKPL